MPPPTMRRRGTSPRELVVYTLALVCSLGAKGGTDTASAMLSKFSERDAERYARAVARLIRCKLDSESRGLHCIPSLKGFYHPDRMQEFPPSFRQAKMAPRYPFHDGVECARVPWKHASRRDRDERILAISGKRFRHIRPAVAAGCVNETNEKRREGPDRLLAMSRHDILLSA
ncbi:MAG: hypothetical protein ACRD2X_19700 [Vicinamibacteraceae bacterium]